MQDHGPGIPDAEKARVFDRFYSADPSRTDKHNFGLGLSVAKELARLQHADLTVTDTPGGGAKFAVTFAARISLCLIDIHNRKMHQRTLLMTMYNTLDGEQTL